jgi:hypothetical protein
MVKFVYRTHAIERLFEREISEEEVEWCVINGEIIESYIDDKPYPSFLVLGYENGDRVKPLHVVFAKNNEESIIITAYRPERKKWSDDYKKRIEK